MNKTNIKDSSDCTSSSPLWQALEYRKRLKKLIEQGASINELDKKAKSKGIKFIKEDVMLQKNNGKEYK